MTDTRITKCLMKRQEELVAKIKSLTDVMNEDLNRAKAIAHDRKIEINRLNKELQEAKDCITLDMQSELNDEKKVEEQYRFKTNTDFRIISVENENEIASRSA